MLLQNRQLNMEVVVVHQVATATPFPFVGQSVVKKMYDVGTTDPEVLYDFAILLNAAGVAMLDPDSEINKAYQKLLDSCWGQLPQKILIDFSPEN